MANYEDPNEPNLNDFDAAPNDFDDSDETDDDVEEDFDEYDDSEDDEDDYEDDEDEEDEEEDEDYEDEDYDDSEEDDEDEDDEAPDDFSSLIVGEAMSNNWDLVFNLIDSGVDINTQDKKMGYSALFFAALEADYEVVKQLIDLGADVNICTKERLTPLFIASDRGRVDVIRLLLEAGADPSIKSDSHASPLHLAFIEKNQEMYDLLMAHGAKKISEFNVLTMLMQQFIGECDFQWFNNCVQQDCTETARSMYSIMVVQPTAGMSDLRFLKALVETGWSIESTTSQGDTLMHLAAQAGELENVKYLESKGLSLESRNNHGETPIHSAIKGGFWYIFDYARQNGIDFDNLDADPVAQKFGTTLLHCAAEGGNVDIVDYLIKKGFDVNAFNYDGFAPLMYAARNHHLEVVDLLLKSGADVNARKKLGLHDPSGDSREAILDINNEQRIRIITRGPQGWLKSKDIVGMTPLHLCIDTWKEKEEEMRPRVFTRRDYNPAVESVKEYSDDYFERKTKYIKAMIERSHKLIAGPEKANQDPKAWVQVAERLIEAGARLNTVCRQGCTPLIRAINKNNFDLVRTLLERGANPNICDSENRTPLQAARDAKNKRIIQLLSKQPKTKAVRLDLQDRYDAALCESEFKKKEEERSAYAMLAHFLTKKSGASSAKEDSKVKKELEAMFEQILAEKGIFGEDNSDESEDSPKK